MSSNYGNIIIDEGWLLTAATPAGRSPLQHFHATWRNLATAARPFNLILLTNRGFTHDDPILGDLRDLKTDKINVSKLRAATPRSKAGQERQRWARHLGIHEDELLDFLAAVTWKHGDSEPGWDERARPLMRLAGLRSDDQAIT